MSTYTALAVALGAVALLFIIFWIGSEMKKSKKKPQKEKGHSKTKKQKGAEVSSSETPKFDKVKKPKVNIRRIKKQDIKIEPAFSKEEVEADALKQKLHDTTAPETPEKKSSSSESFADVRKNILEQIRAREQLMKAREMQTTQAPVGSVVNNPLQAPKPVSLVEKQDIGIKREILKAKDLDDELYDNQFSTERIMQNTQEQNTSTKASSINAREEFLKLINAKNANKQESNVSFGKSLIIGEAIATPKSREKLKKERSKWI